MIKLKRIVEKVKKAQLRHSPGSPIADDKKNEFDVGPAAGGWDSHSGVDDEDD